MIVLQEGLAKNFANVEVEVVDCPDLSAAPFYLAAGGKSLYTISFNYY